MPAWAEGRGQCQPRKAPQRRAQTLPVEKERQGKERERQDLGEVAAHEEVHQLVGRKGEDEGGHHACVGAARLSPNQQEHPESANAGRQDHGQLERRRAARAKERPDGRGTEDPGRLKVEERRAVAAVTVRTPAREQRASPIADVLDQAGQERSHSWEANQVPPQSAPVMNTAPAMTRAMEKRRRRRELGAGQWTASLGLQAANRSARALQPKRSNGGARSRALQPRSTANSPKARVGRPRVGQAPTSRRFQRKSPNASAGSSQATELEKSDQAG